MTKRSIRSYVRRGGRITSAQARAFDRLWPEYGIPFTPGMLDLDAVFGRAARRVLDVGFGNGEALVEQAARCPEIDFLGVEVHTPGVGHCLLQAETGGVGNLRVIAHDVVEVLEQCFEGGAFDRINVYFPDPWPKKRHHKRRLVQPQFLTLAADRLRAGGNLYIATDWENYAEHIDAAVASTPSLCIAERREHGGDRPIDRPTTKFERRGLALGHRIYEWRLTRKHTIE